MAARNDQTTQIAVIVLSILTVLLLGFTYWFWKSSSDAEARIAVLEQQKQSETSAAQVVQSENEQYRQFMGFGQFDNLETVKKQHTEDMKLWGVTFDANEQAYRPILQRIFEDTEKLVQQEADSKEREKALTAQLAQLEAQKDAQIKQYEAELTKAKQDAASERTVFNQKRGELEAKQEELAKTLEAQRTEFEKQIEEKNTKITDVEDQLATAQVNLEALKFERQQQAESFEVPDGRIAWVNQANQTVWINLGENDSLRRQITFSVFEGSETDAAKSKKKGSIEVTRILGEHLAEARITEDDPHNPILPGDNIATPLWHRGKKIHFALTGIIDLDGDGTPDMQQAKDLIALNGGVVDSWVNDRGEVEGEMTVETRYMVLGEHPEQPSQSAERDAWKKMGSLASNLGVETIDLYEFLNQMGYKSLDRTVRMGAGARSDDFPPPSVESSSRFRPRTPYRMPVDAPK